MAITEQQLKKFNELLVKCQDEDDKLSTWETEFVDSFIERVEEYGVDIKISAKQQEILDRIEEKIS